MPEKTPSSGRRQSDVTKSAGKAVDKSTKNLNAAEQRRAAAKKYPRKKS